VAKKLDNLSWKPFWVSHLGCIKGCLDWLDREVSDAWLFGGTGHAFVLNVHETVCPSGPTAWVTERMFALGKNVGYAVDGVFSSRETPGFDEAPGRAWAFARARLDDGVPCYGWELAIPEFYVVNGYDETGYGFDGPQASSESQPKPWAELGAGETGVVEMYSVKAGPPSGEAETVRGAFSFALEHAKNPSRWIFPTYRSGLEGYDTWIEALEAGSADGFGTAYNAAVWSECRRFAVDFLQEARERLEGTAAGVLEEAEGRYAIAARGLKKVEEL